MSDSEIQQLARDWIALRHSREADRLSEPGGGYSERSNELFSASEALDDLIRDKPEDGWRVLLTIHEMDHSWAVRSLLSAGAIEDLLSLHGEQFIGRVEAEAKRVPVFASTLGGLWKHGMTDEIWDRLQRVWDRSGWDGEPGKMKD